MENIKLTYVIGAAISLCCFLLFRRDTTRREGCQDPPKYKLWDPIFGLDYSVKLGLNGQRWLEWFDKYGHTYKVAPLIGINLKRTTQVHTCHSQNVHEIMNSKDWGVAWRRDPMVKLTGLGILTMDGEEWSKGRKMAKPAFSRKNIEDMEFLQEMADGLMKRIPENGQTVDLQPFFYETFMNSSLHWVFGLDPRKNDEGAPFTAHEFNGVWLTALRGLGLRVALGRIMTLFPSTGYSKVVGQIHSFVDFYVKHNSDKPHGDNPQRKNVTQALLAQTDDKLYARHTLVQAMIGAQDTTSTLCSNTVDLLAHNLQFWEELKTEVRDKGDSLMEFDALRENKFIQNLLKESLRLRPVFPAMGREALSDTILPIGGGLDGQSPVFVRKGHHAVANFLKLHRDPAVFGSDAETFNPHRWDTIKPSPKEYVPFGLGPRSCLGKEKAQVEAAYMLARLAREFEGLEPRNEKPYAGRMGFSMTNANGCQVAFKS